MHELVWGCVFLMVALRCPQARESWRMTCTCTTLITGESGGDEMWLAPCGRLTFMYLKKLLSPLETASRAAVGPKNRICESGVSAGVRAAILDCEASICHRELAAAPTPPPPPSRGQIIAQVEECALPSVSGWQAGLERHARARPGARAAILDCEASICRRELAAAPTPPRPPSQCVENDTLDCKYSPAERVHPTIGTVFAHSTPQSVK